MYSAELSELLSESNDAHKRMIPDMNRAAITRINAKKVTDSRLLYLMDSLEGLELHGFGTMDLSNEVQYEGRPTVQFCPPAYVTVKRGRLSKTKTYVDNTYVLCKFPCEDWQEYNRISLWVYPDIEGYENVYFLLGIDNDTKEDREVSALLADSYILELENKKWNHVIWEIPEVHRNRVTGLRLRCTIDGFQKGASPLKNFYFGPIELQKTDVDYYEGWDLENRIAFCHAGYQPLTEKIAYTQVKKTDEFEIVNADTQEVVFTGEIKERKTTLGIYYSMNFSTLTEQGRYYLRVDDRQTGIFSIDEDVYASAVWKMTDYFYQERCGCEIPGIHRVCHLDVYSCNPDGRMLSVAGGWHDAGDLSQGSCNTTESTHAFLNLAEHVRTRDERMYRRLMEEAHWGLDWCLQTRFGDGYRACWTTIGVWTQNIYGDHDDLLAKADNNPFENLCAAAVEAEGARMFAKEEPEFAKDCLKAAKEDFDLAMEKYPEYYENSVNGARSRSAIYSIQLAGEAAFAAAVLYKSTGDFYYAERADEFLQQVMACQETEYQNWKDPIRGFFYENQKHEYIMSYSHRAHEQAPLMALALMYELCPEHVDSKKWKKTMELYGEYIRSIAKYGKPYGMLPNAISKIEHDGITVESFDTGSYGEEFFNEQIRNGVCLAEDVFLRRMPVAEDYRGFNGTMLTKAKAVSSVAKVLKDKELEQIARWQLEWIVGANPFCKSQIYGEGYDFPELFVMFSNQMVGAIPVGIWTNGSHDMPYLPQNTNATHNEVWVHSTSRFLWVLADLY